jgi:hypothetical protein
MRDAFGLTGIGKLEDVVDLKLLTAGGQFGSLLTAGGQFDVHGSSKSAPGCQLGLAFDGI